MKRIKIVVCRHPEKDGDAVTAYGAQQMFAMAMTFAAVTFERIVYSGANRTWQAALVAAAALGLRLEPEKNEGFNFQKTLDEFFGPGNNKLCLAEIKSVKEAGGTVAVALEKSAFARLMRERATAAILELAGDMAHRGQVAALVLSHSPWFEAATLQPETTPYSLGECVAIVFEVEDGKIVATELIQPPLAGKAK